MLGNILIFHSAFRTVQKNPPLFSNHANHLRVFSVIALHAQSSSHLPIQLTHYLKHPLLTYTPHMSKQLQNISIHLIAYIFSHNHSASHVLHFYSFLSCLSEPTLLTLNFHAQILLSICHCWHSHSLIQLAPHPQFYNSGITHLSHCTRSFKFRTHSHFHISEGHPSLLEQLATNLKELQPIWPHEQAQLWPRCIPLPYINLVLFHLHSQLPSLVYPSKLSHKTL